MERRSGRGDLGAQFVAHVDRRRGDDAMHGQAGHRRIGRLHVGDFLAVQREQAAAVAHLAAGLGVERRAVEDQFGLDSGADFVAQFAVDQQALHARGGGQLVVAQELRASLLDQLLIGRRDGALLGALPTGAGALALLLHLAVEAFAVDGQAALAGHVFLLVERQAVSVVQLEGQPRPESRAPDSDFTSSLKTRSATRNVVA